MGNEVNSIDINAIRDGINKFQEGINEAKQKRSDMIPIDIMNKLLKIYSKIVCKIETPVQMGSGFLMKIKKGDDSLSCLFTCAHVIPQNLIDQNEEIKLYYNFNDDAHEEKSIKLDIKERFIRNYEYLNLDYSVIQIFNTEINENFFYIPEEDINNLNNKEAIQDKMIYLFQFPNGENKINYSSGNITFSSIINPFEFYHYASTQPGSSGCPIFIYNKNKEKLIIIGIHKGANINNNFNRGHLIFPIISSLEENANFCNKLKLHGGSQFTGEIHTGNKQKGIYEFEENEMNYKYIGEFIHYKLIGYCKKYINMRLVYEGYFVDDQYDGKGKLINEDGSIYEGEFSKNKKNGEGTLYDKKSKYKGHFKDDKFDGKGELIYEDGGKYVGEFSQNLRHGQGILYDERGKIVKSGLFENNECTNNEANININNEKLDEIGNFALDFLQDINKNIFDSNLIIIVIIVIIRLMTIHI